MNELRHQSTAVEEQWKRGLRISCGRFIRQVLWHQPGVSSDWVETLTEQLASIAEHHAGFADEMFGDWKIVSRAIDYLATLHDGPWRGADWFKTSLDVLMELAVPNTGLDSDTAAFLPDLQRGINQALRTLPVDRNELKLSDEDVSHVMTLRDAGEQFGLVSDLFDVCEKISHGEPLDESDQWILKLASNAAPFTRVARKGN